MKIIIHLSSFSAGFNPQNHLLPKHLRMPLVRSRSHECLNFLPICLWAAPVVTYASLGRDLSLIPRWSLDVGRTGTETETGTGLHLRWHCACSQAWHRSVLVPGPRLGSILDLDWACNRAGLAYVWSWGSDGFGARLGFSSPCARRNPFPWLVVLPRVAWATSGSRSRTWTGLGPGLAWICSSEPDRLASSIAEMPSRKLFHWLTAALNLQSNVPSSHFYRNLDFISIVLVNVFLSSVLMPFYRRH
jgi:hypothetical protein